MDITRAVEILNAVAQGVNPFTGEVLPADCICNQVEMVRALYCVLNEVKPSLGKKEKSQPENAGKPWTQEDDAILLQMFDHNYAPDNIEEYFKRSQGSIASRLVRLGKIESRDEYRRRRE